MTSHEKIAPERGPNEVRQTVVIVGAGFAGLAAAQGLAKADIEVILIDRTNHHLFQPLLYQVATAALSPADIAVATRARLRHQRNATMLMAEVVGVDRARRTVNLSDGGTVSYDWLILATGADYSFFGRPDWEAHAHVLKSLDDALVLRSTLLCAFEKAELEGNGRAPAVVVIGGGPTGVEMAGAIAEMARATLAGDFRRTDPAQARILLFEAGPRLLPAFSVRQAAYAERALTALGVEVRTAAPVAAMEAGTIVSAGQRILADVIVWCAGVQARPVAGWLGLAPSTAGRTPVGPDCALVEDERVFVLGDVSAFADGGGLLPGLAPVAKQQGRHVARTLRGRLAGRPGPGRFVYRDWGAMAVIGRSRAVATFGRIELRGVVAWLAWSLVHLMLLVDFRSRASVYLNWTWAWITRGRAARLITGSP